MKLVVGLGNTGTDYENTRHNIGRSVVLALGENLGENFNLNKKANSMVAETKSSGEKLVIVVNHEFESKFF